MENTRNYPIRELENEVYNEIITVLEESVKSNETLSEYKIGLINGLLVFLRLLRKY